MTSIISKIKTSAAVKLFAGIALAMGMTTSCCNEQQFPDPESGTVVYFAQQVPVRTITLGNDDDAVNVDDNAHQFKLQAVMGGVYSNKEDRDVRFMVDPSLLATKAPGTTMEVLPESYYEFVNPTTLTIPKGAIIGGTVVKLKDAFFNDPKAATTHYVLPVRLVSTNDFDRILEDRDYQMLCVKYQNEISGLYCKTGKVDITCPALQEDVDAKKAAALGNTVTETVNYKNEDALVPVTCTALGEDAFTLSYTIKKAEYDEELAKMVLKDFIQNFDFVLKFTDAARTKCDVLCDGVKVGEGKFTPRGIQDFSNVNRKADLLEVTFKTETVTNPGDAVYERTWKFDASMKMSLMSRNVKFETWK